jgi:hypothetical protein
MENISVELWDLTVKPNLTRLEGKIDMNSGIEPCSSLWVHLHPSKAPA